MSDPQTARAGVDAATAALHSAHPQPGRLRLFLSSVAGAAPGVTAVAQAVSELTDHVRAVLS